MAASTRIVGQNIVFKIDGDSFAPDVQQYELSLGDAPGGVRTMSEVRTNGEWALKVDGILSGDASSLYQLLWLNNGTEVGFVVGPNGNTSASADAPHFSGTVVFNELPPLAQNAGEDGTFSVTLRVKNTGHDPADGLFYGLTRVVA